MQKRDLARTSGGLEPNLRNSTDVTPMPEFSSLEHLSGQCRLDVFKRGRDRYEKTSYPSRTGIYHEIISKRAVLHFNLNGEIIRLAGRGKDWPHPQEWLKRTIGNDWIYYSTGGYTGVFETTGEYYLPNLPYPTNNHMGGRPFETTAVKTLIRSWFEDARAALADVDDGPSQISSVARRILASSPEALAAKSGLLRRITGGPVSVLPPDTRHVDYQVIPLNISRGCLYKCGFCRVKNSSRFTPLNRDTIEANIGRLADFFGDDLTNFNAAFLGDHDALNCEPDLILEAIQLACAGLRLDSSSIRGGNVFMFGSVSSLMKHKQVFFDALGRLPISVYINIGLESAHQNTLDLLEKPLSAHEVAAAFERMQQINQACPNVEMTANFVTGQELPDGHYEALLSLVRNSLNSAKSKGCIYLSPLQFDSPSRARLFDFYRLKRLSRLPLFMYTIQRL